MSHTPGKPRCRLLPFVTGTWAGELSAEATLRLATIHVRSDFPVCIFMLRLIPFAMLTDKTASNANPHVNPYAPFSESPARRTLSQSE